MRRSVWGVIAFLALFFSVCVPRASAQAVYGSVFGSVTDSQGAAIIGAKVTVTSVTKGTTEQTTTNESGNYTVTHLIPDVYSITIETTGFKTFEQKSVQVAADVAARLDAQLEVGAVSQSVIATAEAPQLKTDRADVSVEFNEKYVADLPLFNRNFTSLELAMPGTQKLVGWSHAATENPQGSQQIFVGGQHFSGTGYELDGTDNQDPILGIIVINPNLDAVGETKITLQNFDAEFGKSIAGLVTAQTKSGTNELHGSAFWYRRSDAEQARDPFTQSTPNPITGRLLPPGRWNQFGGSVGGPILKDKLFVFGDYQGTRQTNGITNLETIPTATVVSSCNPATNGASATPGFCDLRQYQPFIGNGKAGDPSNAIYDPSTGAVCNSSSPPANCTGSGRTAFSNFMIPISRIPSQAAAILALFPKPSTSAVTNNFFGSGSGPFHQNAFDTRADYNFSQSLHIFGRYSLAYFSISGNGSLGPLGGPGFGQLGLNGSSIIHNHSLSVGFDKTIGPTLLTDFRFGYFKYNPQTQKSDQGTTPMNTFGVPNMNLGDTATSGLAAFFMDGTMTNFGDGLNVGRCNCPLTEDEHQYQFVNNWTKIRGNHTIKVGADIRHAYNLRIPSDANRTGQLNFNHKGTSNAGTGGLDLATFLLGDVTFMDRYVSSSLDASETQQRVYLYGEDNWRVTSKFTLTYGLRWEDYTPESVNRTGNGGFANLDEGIVRVAGHGPYGLNGNIDNDLHYFAPRVGVAYEVNPKTVLRVGYGRSYDMGVFGSNFGHTVTQNLPVLVNQNVSASSHVNSGASNDIVPAFTLASGPPLFVFPTIPSNGAFPLQGPLGNVSPKIRPTFQRLPSIDAWNAAIQRTLTNTMTLEIAYIGNKGSHGFSGDGPSYNANQVAAGSGTSINGSFVPAVSQAQRRPFFNAYSYPGFFVLDPVTGLPVTPATTLTCCSSDLGNYLGNDVSSKYNALQIKVNKRFSQGLQFVSFYVYSQAYHYNADYLIDNPHIAYGPYDQNRNHQFVTDVVYELPVGKGKRFMTDAGRAMDYIVGGWRLTTTTNWSGGLPWTPTYGECGQDIDAGPCRPNKARGSLSLGVHKVNGLTYWYTPIQPLAISAPAGTDFCLVARPVGQGFSRPGCGQIGNIGFDSFRGPRSFTSDFSISKNFGITERVKAEFRMDAYNLFNHPVMGFNANQGNTCIDCFSNADAGRITDIEADTQMRQLQFGLRFTF